MDTWKAFENNEITHSGAHYLMAITDLIEDQGCARVSDVARVLDVTRGSASLALKALREKNLVKQCANRSLKLTDEGSRIAQEVLTRRRVVEMFFRELLRIDSDQAAVDACKIEHLISTESGARMLALIRYLTDADDDTQRMLRRFWATESICTDQSRCAVCEAECIAHAWKNTSSSE